MGCLCVGHLWRNRGGGGRWTAGLCVGCMDGPICFVYGHIVFVCKFYDFLLICKLRAEFRACNVAHLVACRAFGYGITW